MDASSRLTIALCKPRGAALQLRRFSPHGTSPSNVASRSPGAGPVDVYPRVCWSWSTRWSSSNSCGRYTELPGRRATGTDTGVGRLTIDHVARRRVAVGAAQMHGRSGVIGTSVVTALSRHAPIRRHRRGLRHNPHHRAIADVARPFPQPVCDIRGFGGSPNSAFPQPTAVLATASV